MLHINPGDRPFQQRWTNRPKLTGIALDRKLVDRVGEESFGRTGDSIRTAVSVTDELLFAGMRAVREPDSKSVWWMQPSKPLFGGSARRAGGIFSRPRNFCVRASVSTSETGGDHAAIALGGGAIREHEACLFI